MKGRQDGQVPLRLPFLGSELGVVPGPVPGPAQPA